TPKYSNQKIDDELFSLLRHAANYDLFDFNERLRSHHDLVRLFNSLINVFKPGLFVEAGAFWAEASRDIKRRLPQTRVVAFEANPYNYAMCTAEVDYEAAGVEYVHTALSSKPGDVTFKVPTSKNNEPMDKTMGRASILERTDAKFTHEMVTVPGTTLDAFF